MTPEERTVEEASVSLVRVPGEGASSLPRQRPWFSLHDFDGSQSGSRREQPCSRRPAPVRSKFAKSIELRVGETRGTFRKFVFAVGPQVSGYRAPLVLWWHVPDRHRIIITWNELRLGQRSGMTLTGVGHLHALSGQSPFSREHDHPDLWA